MRIIELVLQGVAGNPGLTRLKLGAGTTVLRPEHALPLVKLIGHALYDESVEPPADLRDPQASASRIALTLQDHSGQVYRVLRDLASGATQLSRYDPAGKSFATVSTRAAEAGQFLRSQARLAPEDLFRDLLCLQASQKPSLWVPPKEESPGGLSKKRSMPVMGGAAAAAHYESQAAGAGQQHSAPRSLSRPSVLDGADAGTSLGGAPDPFAGLSLEAKREKLSELESRKAALEEADDLQFSLEGKQRSLFELDQKRKKLTEAESRVKQLAESLTQHGDLEGLDEDLERKLKEHDFLSSRLENTLQRITDDREKLEEKLEYEVLPPYKSVLFQAGAGAAVLFTLAGLFFEPVRWLLFLNFVPLGLVAFTLLEWIGEIEDHDGVDAKRAVLNEREEQARKQFEVETTGLRLLMSRLQVDKVSAIKERLAAAERSRQAYEAARDKLEEMKASPDLAEVDSQRSVLEREIEEIEARLRECGTAGVSPVDLMRDIEALRASIDRSESGYEQQAPEAATLTPAPFSEMGVGSASVVQQPLDQGPVMPDPAPRLLSRLGDALLCPPSEAAEKVQGRVSQFSGALTQGRWTAVGFHGRGGTMLASNPQGASAAWEEVPAADRDRIFLAIRLAFAEAVVRASPQPLLFELAFDDPDFEQVRPVLAKIARHLGGLTQTVHLTIDPFWEQHADSLIPLSAAG